jgi:uncharacterized membrane protein
MKAAPTAMIAVMAVVTSLPATQATAQTHASDSDCYHVSYANQGALPGTAIKWNSCTGETWLLLEVSMVDAHGKRVGGAWEWLVVPTSKETATSN